MSTNHHFTEYTPLVQERYFYVYRFRENESVLEKLRRAIVFILVTCLLSFVFFAILSALLQMVTVNEPYTYYLFTKRWPVTECKGNSKCVQDLTKYNRWLIHGLWPEFSNNTWDQYCTKVKFNESEVESLKSELLVNWPNLLRDQPEDSLWKHEYEKHGTCSNRLNEFNYFARTLSLHNRFNLDQWLAQANITPSNTLRYSVSQFINAIGQHISDDSVALNCERRHGGHYLKEIYICVSFVDAQTLIPCTVETTCQEDFFYPALE